MCNDPHLAEEVVRLQGLKRLVELCKCESARVASDGVLVACLAAVRKVISYFLLISIYIKIVFSINIVLKYTYIPYLFQISAAVGTAAFEEMDAAELVEPRLLDSFLIFSSRNESFV